MKPCRNITEADILVTEKLIVKSYYQLKQSVIQSPAHVIETVGQTVQKNPFAVASAALVAGMTVYSLSGLTPSTTKVEDTQRSSDSVKEEHFSSDFVQCMILSILPSMIPVIVEYILKYSEKNLSE